MAAHSKNSTQPSSHITPRPPISGYLGAESSKQPGFSYPQQEHPAIPAILLGFSSAPLCRIQPPALSCAATAPVNPVPELPDSTHVCAADVSTTPNRDSSMFCTTVTGLASQQPASALEVQHSPQSQYTPLQGPYTVQPPRQTLRRRHGANIRRSAKWNGRYSGHNDSSTADKN